jgi:hypothetical protein
MSQKIPLFDGVMKPVGSDPAVLVNIFTPPDKNLADGTQAFYEVHLWVMPALVPLGGAGDGYALVAIQDSAPASPAVIWQRNDAELSFQSGLPVKILDGYPVRGDVTIQGLFKANLNSTNLFGYYYRVGQGDVVQTARRFIGQDLSPSVNAGLSIPFVVGDKKVIHKFSQGRIDEISLAFQKLSTDADVPIVILRFEDAGGVIIPGTEPISFNVRTLYDYQRNPSSPYTFYQMPFGGNKPTLAQLSLEYAADGIFVAVHGYFTRH